MSALVCKGLQKSGRLLATDLVIEPGERVALVGHNGAGKSTLLRLATGLLRPSAGSVMVFGKPVDDPEARTDIGLLLDRSTLPDRMTAHEVMAQCGHTDAGGTLKLLGVEEADKAIGTLSSGQRQRVALALALAGSPKLLLLDEPLSGLDDPGVRTVSDVLQASKATMLIATHRRDTLRDLWTRELSLAGGRLV